MSRLGSHGDNLRTAEVDARTELPYIHSGQLVAAPRRPHLLDVDLEAAHHPGDGVVNQPYDQAGQRSAQAMEQHA